MRFLLLETRACGLTLRHCVPRQAQKELLLGLALRHLDSARAVSAAWRAAVDATGTSPSADDAKPDVFLLLLQFQLARYQDSTAGQLAAVSAAQANPAFRAEHFLRMAAMLESKPGRGSGDGSNLGRGTGLLIVGEEIARAVHTAAYQRLIAQTPLNYILLAKARQGGRGSGDFLPGLLAFTGYRWPDHPAILLHKSDLMFNFLTLPQPVNPLRQSARWWS